MQKFSYKALDTNMNVIKDYIEEDNIENAIEKLRIKGYKVIKIKKSRSLLDIKLGGNKLKDEHIASFCGQMGIIINTGVSILKGLDIIKNQDKKLKKASEAVLKGVKRGETLGKSMEDSGMFPVVLTHMVYSGEVSGNIDEILFNMENFYQREAHIKNKIKNASIYPIVLLVLTIAMLMFFNLFIFSKISNIFADSKNLPKITIFIMNTMNFFNNNILLVPFVVLGLIVLIRYVTKVPRMKYFLDKIVLKIPVVGEVKKYIIINRFCRSMGIFIRSAVPILTALDNIQRIINNSFVSYKIGNAKKKIVNGAKIADTLQDEKIFDDLTIHMIRIGEETGKLEQMFFKLTDIYDKKVEIGINKLMALVEPLFTLIIGLVVGVVMIGIALPIFKMSNTI
ncbi:type II secretion system F family protein [Haloimpatiens sp. FM7330]|uniref:type II secretion system F family protein n=1 Tax=Haloimpatiens sp. FM7330 TaxID=3298610 RepID=UPI0036276ED7